MASKKRVKSDSPTVVPIENWDKADDYVRKIGELQMRIEQARQSATDDINDRKAELAEETTPLQEEIKLYSQSLEVFCANNKKAFGQKRSRKLNFGLVGWRKSTSISVKKTTLELIKKVFKGRDAGLVRIKESVDKDALSKLTDEQLTRVGARRKVKDDFFVEPTLVEPADFVE